MTTFLVRFTGWLYLGGKDRDGRDGAGWVMTHEARLPFVPAVGTSLGPTDAVQVTAVRWLGQTVPLVSGDHVFECEVDTWHTRPPRRHDYQTDQTPEGVHDLLRRGKTTPDSAPNTFHLDWRFDPKG